jgi:hypothetical protein
MQSEALMNLIEQDNISLDVSSVAQQGSSPSILSMKTQSFRGFQRILSQVAKQIGKVVSLGMELHVCTSDDVLQT